MANQFLNAVEYSQVMLLLVKNNLVMGRLVDGRFQNEINNENNLTINVKRPPRFLDKKDGTSNISVQDIVTGSTPIVADQLSKVHTGVGDFEYIQSANDLMRHTWMMSAGARIAQAIDSFLISKTLLFNSWVAGGQVGGAGGTDASTGISPLHTTSEAMSAHTRLMNQGVPNDGNLRAVVDFTDAELLRGNLTGSFMDNLNQTALQKVKIPLMSEIDWYATQNIPSFTTGTRTQGDGSSTGSQISGANQNVNYRSVKTTMTQTLLITGTNGQTIVAGEVVTIQNVFAWDFNAQQTLDYLQQFTVVTGGTVASGTVSLTISPAIIVQGTSDGVTTDTNSVFGNVGTAPANNAFVKFVGAASTKLKVRTAFHKRAIAMVSTPLRMPDTGVASMAVDEETGIAIRYWRGSDIATGNHFQRWDCVYGAAMMDPSLGTRIVGFGG